MDNKKDKILETTIHVMGNSGLHASMKDVVKQVGCSESLIYKYYKTRKKLMFACFNNICKEICLDLSTISPHKDPLKEEFKEYLHSIWITLYEYFKNNEEKRHFFVQYCSDFKLIPKNIKASCVIKNILGENYSILHEYFGDRVILIFGHMIFEAIFISSWLPNDEIRDIGTFNGIFNT